MKYFVLMLIAIIQLIVLIKTGSCYIPFIILNMYVIVNSLYGITEINRNNERK